MAVDKRRMCPNCRAFITSDDKVCPYCQVQLGARIVETRRSDASNDQFTTMIILMINTGLYVMMAMQSSTGFFNLDQETLYRFGAKYGPAIYSQSDPQWWRLITAGFLHGGLLHIGMNSWVLWDLGPQVEQVFGTPRFLTIFFLSTITGFLASLYWTPGVLSIGASAALCGLIGAMVGLGTKDRNSVAGMMRGRFIQWMLMLVAFGFFIPGIDNAAHLGGFAGGFAVAYIAGAPTYSASIEGGWKIGSLVALAITAYAFVRMVLWAT